MSHFPRLALTAAAAFLATSAFAQNDPDTDWEVFTPPANSTPTAGPVGPQTPEGGFSTPERVIFSEKMRERVLDQLCRNLRLQYDYNLPGDFNGTGGGFKRYLAPLPDGRLTLVDMETIRVGYGHTFSKVLDEASGLTGGVWFGGKLEGSSMVIRPLETKATCKEIDRMVDLRDIKTVLPFKAERITAMKVGELWRIPFTLTVGHTESISDALTPELNVSLSFNGTEAGAATLTVFRLSDSQLRFRYRVDRVEIRTKSGQLAGTFPAIELPSLGANILAKIIDRGLASQLHQYTMASLGFSSAKSHGKKVVLEYVVDPRDPAQAEAVAQALHGDFRALVLMGWHMGTQQATDASTEAAYRRMQKEHDEQLGPASFAAINAYNQKARNITLMLPFLTSQHWGKVNGDETMTRYTDIQGEIHFERADKTHQGEWFSLPFVGPLVKNQSQRDVQVVSAAKSGDALGDPIVVYLEQHGYLRNTESAVRGDANGFSDIMELAGTRGAGRNPKLRLPLDGVLPPPPPTDHFSEEKPGESADRKGSMSFTLVFNQAGVKQLLASTKEDVLKAFAATQESSPELSWLLENGKWNERTNELEYDWRAARRRFPDDDNRGVRSSQESEVAALARTATGLVTDLFEARDASGNQARSEALARAFSGQGRSKLDYQEALKVFVQLVDPTNLTADFNANIDRPKKEKDINAHLVLRKDRPDNPLLKLAGEAKGRFAEPSILTD